MATTQVGYDTKTGRTISKTRGDGYTEYFDFKSGTTVKKYDDGKLDVTPASPDYKPPEEMPKFGRYKTKLPAQPTKINVKTGTGVPGGFTGASNKVPTVETAKYSSAVSGVASNLSKIKTLVSLAPSAAALLAPFKSKMNSMLSSLTKKMKDARQAPNFKAPASIPKLPSAPPISVPSLPSLPELPSLPPAPTVPSISDADNARRIELSTKFEKGEYLSPAETEEFASLTKARTGI